jgi:hypothetical protein
VSILVGLVVPDNAVLELYFSQASRIQTDVRYSEFWRFASRQLRGGSSYFGSRVSFDKELHKALDLLPHLSCLSLSRHAISGTVEEG